MKRLVPLLLLAFSASAGTFVTGNTPLPPLKTDKTPPTGASTEMDAADINNAYQDLDDLRTHGKGYVSVLEYGAVCDGTADDTSKFQAAIDANKGKTITIPGPGNECVVAGVTLADSTYNGTRLISTGGWIKLKPDAGASTFGGAWVGVLVGTADNVEINLKCDGNRSAMTAREQIYCLGVAGATRLRIPELVVREIRGDGLYIGQSSWTASSTNPSDIHVGSVVAVNTADDGRNAVSIISGNRISVDHLDSYQVGGVIGAVTEPGGIDLEPDQGYESISDFTLGSANITTAGTSGFSILGKSTSGSDPARDWNIQRVTVKGMRIVRTGTSASALSAIGLIRAQDVSVDADTAFTNGYGTGWQLDFLDRANARLGASHVNMGVRVGPVGEVRDFGVNVKVTQYSVAGLRASQVSSGRFSGRISNSVSVSSSTPYAIQTHNEGGSVTQNNVIYSVDAPYDGLAARAFRNEPGNAVAFNNCQVRDCDFSGYSAFNTMFDDQTVSPFKQNIEGLATSAAPSNGRWNQGEVVPNSSPLVIAGGYALTGWQRVTTGSGNVLGTDWLNVYFSHQPAVGVASPANGGTVTPNLALEGKLRVTFGAGVANATISNPAAPGQSEQQFEITEINSSGGTIATTWGTGYVFATSWVEPANGKEVSVVFHYDSANDKYRELYRTTSSSAPSSGAPVSLQSSYPGVPDNGNANLSGSLKLGGDISVNGSVTVGGHVGATQFTSPYSFLGDRNLALNLENMAPAYVLHSLGQVRHQAIATPAAPVATPGGNKGNTITTTNYTNVTFANSGSTITRTAGSWISDGYVVGSAAVVTGSASNNATYTITAVTATVLTVTPAPVNEGPTTAPTFAGQFGTTTYSYTLACHDSYSAAGQGTAGGITNVSSAGTTTQGNTTLSASNFVNVSFVYPDGTTTCDVLKSDNAHLLGTLTKPASSIQDTGQATSAYTAPTRNTTADVRQDGWQITPAASNASPMFRWDTDNAPTASGSTHVFSWGFAGVEKMWLDGNGEGWLTSNLHLTGSLVATSAGLKAPVVAGAATAQQVIQVGTKTLTAGSGSVTFSPAFSATPVCTCSETTAANSFSCSFTATTLTMTGTGTDTLAYNCTGAQ